MNIRGSMSFSGGIRLDGKLYGNLSLAEGSAGSVIMGPKSKIIGDITTDSAIIAGEVKGNIEAIDFLELHSTAVVNGDIVYGALEVHLGAIINGTLTETKKKNINKKINNKEIKNDK